MIGIDVSDHNHVSSWPKVKRAGYTFAFVKTTEGTSVVSPATSKSQCDGALEANMSLGVYHFASLHSTLTGQSDAFISSIPPGATMAALDVEPPFSSTLRADELAAWCNNFIRAVHAVKPSLRLYVYMDVSDASRIVWDSIEPVASAWVSNPAKLTVPSHVPVSMTQIGTRIISGIIGPVDIDVMTISEGSKTVATVEPTIHVADYRKPVKAVPYTERDMTVPQMTAESFEMLTQLLAASKK